MANRRRRGEDGISFEHRDPRRDDHTTYTAVAPDLAFTVRTFGTSPLYGPPLVRKFSSREQQTSR